MASTIYAEGVHAVGIDRIIAEAGVAKASFYNGFRSKDELVRAYLEEQFRQHGKRRRG
jgi:AcrR family transcriptional regulator